MRTRVKIAFGVSGLLVAGLATWLTLYYRDKAEREWSREEKAELDRIFAGAEKAAQLHDVERKTALGGAAAVVPRRDLGACKVEAPDMNSMFDRFRVSVVRGPEDLEKASHDTTEVRRRIDEIGYGFASKPERMKRARELPHRQPKTELVLVVADELRPQEGADASFMPGVLAGTLFLWDPTSRSLACAADVRSSGTSDAVLIARGKAKKDSLDDPVQNQLTRHLEEDVIEEAAKRLVIAGPR